MCIRDRACSGHRTTERDSQELLETLGLVHRTRALSAELSGGEKTRLAALLALLKRPRVLLADEPTAALDVVNSKRMMEMLVGAAEQDGVTVLVVSHDPLVFDLAHGALELSKTRRGEVNVE